MIALGRNPDVQQREEDEDVGLLYDRLADKVFILNKTALWLWGQLASGTTLKELLAKVRSEFTVDADEMCEVAEQVAEYLLNLRADNLISLEVGQRAIS